MAQSRKVLEYTKSDNYRTLKFYCDWALHTSKDVIIEDIRIIMRNINDSLMNLQFGVPSNNSMISFLYLDHLRTEFADFFKKYKLPLSWLDDNQSWEAFMHLLLSILEDQPIKNPISEIKEFVIFAKKDIAIYWRISFNDNRRTMQFANAY